MRIAFVSVMTGSPWAASEVLWAETADLALREGHEVLVSTFDWPERPTAIAELERDGAQLDMRPLSRWYRRSALFTRLKRSFRTLKKFKPDVICVSQGGTYDVSRSGGNAVLRSTLSSLGVPYILLCHCEQPAPPARNLSRARALFEGAAIVGMVADKMRAVSEAHLGVAIPNVRTFHNPVNLRTIECLPWPEQNSPIKFAFVGRLDPVKNVAALIETLASDRWQQRDWTLTVCGAGPDRAKLETQVKNAGLAHHVTFAGYVSDIAALWREHHALIMPSRFEGVPLAMIEAMLCGRPVVATDVGGIAEWIEEDRNGFLIRRPDPQDIDSALEKLWSQRERLEMMGRNAHERTIKTRDSDPARTLLQWLASAAATAATADAQLHSWTPKPSAAQGDSHGRLAVIGSSARISVVIPTYEPERFLVDALQSVLAQDPGADVMQIAIIDDGSRRSRAADLVQSIAPAGRVEIHEHDENIGLAGNWNRAVALARGEFVHILHQDDIVEPGFYQRLLAGLDSSPRVGMAFCRHGYIDEQGRVERISHRERWHAGVLSGWLPRIAQSQRIQCPAAIVRRSVYEQLGGFRSELRYALDWEMWVRIAARYDVWFEPTVCAHYRRHSTTESARLEASGKINEDLMNAIEMFSAYLPIQLRAHLKDRAYRRLARSQLRRALKLLDGRAPLRAADEIDYARTAMQQLAPNLAKRLLGSRLSRVEARVASRLASDRT
jgi:glycosyltransferase involved in cell wall biosynthesis/GT2 family glycosyltransferase